MIVKRLFFLLFCLAFIRNGCAQLMEYPILSDSTRILFIGEAHRIEENHSLQLELIKHYVETESFNAIILERSSSLQVIIDNLIKDRDTTNLSLMKPFILCNVENCQHNLKPVIDFLIQVTDFAREKNIPVYCFDTEEDFSKTKQILLSITDTSYTVNPRKGDVFEKLKRSDSHLDINNELLKLYETKNKWKKHISEPAYGYINKIITTVYLQSKENRYMKLRENYLYNQFNTLFKNNKELKPIAIYGLAHTHKHCESELNNLSKPMHQSVVSYLNNNEKSVCKDKVTSIVLTYFFNIDDDSSYTYMGYFENEDLKLLKDSLGNQKYFISKTTNIPISPYLQKAFDYVISINDCHKLLEHTRFYRKPIIRW